MLMEERVALCTLLKSECLLFLFDHRLRVSLDRKELHVLFEVVGTFVPSSLRDRCFCQDGILVLNVNEAISRYIPILRYDFLISSASALEDMLRRA